jgi:hypothetical protein
MSDDSEREVSQLLQCLLQDKKPLGFLLGAGCPFSVMDESNNPLVPDIKGLTEAVKNKVCQGSCTESWKEICSQLEEDTDEEPNIEDILTRVRGLRDYAGSGEVRGLKKKELDELENRICAEIIECVRKELLDKSSPFHNLAIWIRAIDRSYPIEIFTTNYDLLIEQSLEDLQVPFFDGFVGAHKPFFDPHSIEIETLPPRWARLWKIHGSINWKSGIIDGNFRVWRSDIEKGGQVVIHPSHLKYEQSRKMPYLAMMDRLRKFLGTPSSALIIVGYSFGDQHLNELIVQGLQGSPTTIAFALMYKKLSTYSTAIKLAKENGNLSVIAEDGCVVGTKKTLWKDTDDQPDSNLPKGTIEWRQESNGDDKWKASFKLGDFKSFGEFLLDISGKKESGG